jgi:hypothetical protein
MNEPPLYRRYTPGEAIALFGPAEQARNLCDGQWVVLPHHVLGFATVGVPPGPSHFPAASRFCWAADRPNEFPDDFPPLLSGLSHHRSICLPQEVRAGRQQDLPIHLFARRPDEDRFAYLGRLGQSHSWGSGSPGRNFGEAWFRLSPPLPSRVWAALGGLRLDGLDSTSLDSALARLNQPAAVEERLAVLRQLVDCWHGPIGPEDGLPDEALDRPLPLPLRWWYRLAGRRRGLVDGYNILSGPNELTPIEGDRVMFLSENQGGYGWATFPEGDDPPVWGSIDCGAEPWVEEGMTLSQFLVQACLFEAVSMAPYRATARVDAAGIARLTAAVPPLPLAAWHWPVFATRFHVGGGAFLFTEQYSEDSFSITVGARTEHPLERLACTLYGAWERIDWAPPPIDPACLWWAGGVPLQLGRSIREEGRFQDLPVLADALEEAGCSAADLLGHLRRQGLHTRGCHVLDALLQGHEASFTPTA